MQLQPIVYTTDMERAVAWYGLVLDTDPAYASDVWTSFSVGSATLGVHHVTERPVDSNVVLSLIAEGSLDEELIRLEESGIAIARGIQDEPFGRSLVVLDPDGGAVQINEHAH